MSDPARVEALDGHLFGAEQPCFGCGPTHPIGFHLAFAREGEEIVTRFTPGAQYQGPIGIMHGGLVSTLADETAAWAIIALLGKFGFTAGFTAKFHAPVRIDQEVEARAAITRDGKRIVGVAVRIRQNGAVAFSGEFTFVVLDAQGTERLLGRPIPDAWKRFCR